MSVLIKRYKSDNALMEIAYHMLGGYVIMWLPRTKVWLLTGQGQMSGAITPADALRVIRAGRGA